MIPLIIITTSITQSDDEGMSVSVNSSALVKRENTTESAQESTAPHTEQAH